jgi:peptide/nickel transport system substrate-binding protein
MLVVCLNEEPSSLYLYGDTTPELDTILQALYDGPLDVLSHEYQPVILTKLPDIDDGDVSVSPVRVEEGESYFNPITQVPDTLEVGKPYLPSGCYAQECARFFAGGEAQMDQMTVEFSLLPDVEWSDGEPLKASDSVFSFQIDAADETRTTKFIAKRTSSYVALDDRRTLWTGIPGFIDPEYQANFWTPLPEHRLGEFDISELETVAEAAQEPIGWGPYVLESWEPGRQMVFAKSENYFRSQETLPAFEKLRFRFLGGDPITALEQLLTGECDVLDESLLPTSSWANVVELGEQGELEVLYTSGMVLERIDFNIAPSGDSGVQLLFADARVRRAIRGCIDRQGLVEEVLHGLSELPESYLSPAHPLSWQGEGEWYLTPEEAEQVLGRVGWLDDDGDPSTPRHSQGVPGLLDGTPFQFKLLTTMDGLHREIAERVKEDLALCGISAEVEFGNATELFTPYPNGPIFGGRFEAVAWGWPIFVAPACELYLSSEIPSAGNVFGVNASGFRDPQYDELCQRILYGPSWGEDYEEAVVETQEIYVRLVPSIPLLIRPRLFATRTDVCRAKADPTAFSLLWNLEEIDAGESCSATGSG